MKTFFRWAIRLVILLLVVVGLVAAWAFRPNQDNLSAYLSLGENYDVEILRDTWGVPHIFGVTDADAAFGLAYAHAEDDFLTIQQGAIAARGDLALVYGADAAPNDFMVELLRIWENVDLQYDTILSAEVRAICEAYADGLNLYAAEHEDEAFRSLFPLTGKDIVAASVHKSPLFFGLDGTLGRLFNRVSEDNEAAQIGWDLFASWGGNYDDAEPIPTLGSNVFAVAPSRTEDGSTYLAVNSHQPWTGPVAWYEAHIHSEQGWNMTGGLFPGMPVVVVGHNENLGWAFTVNSPDLKDVYELTLNPQNSNQYWFEEAWRDFEVRPAPIDVNVVATLGWGDEWSGFLPYTSQEEVFWSIYGPVLRDDDTAFAIRYAGAGGVGIYEQLFHMNKAANLDEWLDAFAIQGLPMFNAGYADGAGNIGYIYHGLLPLRAEGFAWEETLPGDSAETLWRNYLPFEDLPSVFNPPSGFIQNANSSPFETTFGAGNPDSAAFSDTFGIETTMSNRAVRLLELFEADETVTWDEFVDYKYDMTFSAESDIPKWVGWLVSAEFTNPDAQAAAALFADWNYEAHPDSNVAGLLGMTIYHLNEMDGVEMSVSNLLGSGVTEPQLLAAFEQAVGVMMEHFGRIDPPYSEVNRVRRGTVDMGIGGSADTPHAIYGTLQDDGRLGGVAGDSFVQMVRWDADGNVSSDSIHQFGAATLDENSPHYADQVPLFVARDLKPVWFTEADIRANLERAYRPGK